MVSNLDPISYRDAVSSSLKLAALIITPRESVGAVLKAIRGTLYAQRGVRNVLEIDIKSNNGAYDLVTQPEIQAAEGVERCKLLLMDPKIFPATTSSIPIEGKATAWPPVSVADAASTLGIPSSIIEKLQKVSAAFKLSTTTFTVELTFRNYTMPELLRMVLPAGSEEEDTRSLVALSGFEQVGHIAHVNLSKGHIPHQYVIGQVILDCNPTVDVVVNKVDSISSVFREFKMDVIANRNNPDFPADAQNQDQEALNELLTATVRQHGCLFKVPYNRVYWNSRLSHEHTRLVEQMSKGDALFDVMAGIGPFAIPAAKRGTTVYANDLNPVSSEYMKINGELNHVAFKDMLVFNLDGREFMNCVLYDSVMGRSSPCTGRRHVTMNLPAIAVEFLDVFSPNTAGSPWQRIPSECALEGVDRNVLIHVYCFTPAADVLGDAVRQVEYHLGYQLEEKNKESVVMVRDVAPTKRMVCVSFTLPDAFWENAITASECSSSPQKIAKCEK